MKYYIVLPLEASYRIPHAMYVKNMYSFSMYISRNERETTLYT